MKTQKKCLRRVVLFGLISLLTSCTGSPAGDQITDLSEIKVRAGPIHIITATDLHYLSPRLNDKGFAIQEVSKLGDGKNLPYSAEIVEAFIDQVIQDKPDALILTGDLTFNGEAASHEDLVKLLAKVQEHQIPVAVLPGNHDIAIPDTFAFAGNKAIKTQSISYDRFKELYNSFGYAQARLKDRDSFSYILEVSEDYWVAMIDVNTENSLGRISKKTMTWLESALQQAQLLGKSIISATHQNIRIHNEFFNVGFMVANNLELKALLDKYGVRYNMTGHIHIQHLTLDEKSVNESATGALSVSPHNFAHVRIDEERNLEYLTEPVDVAGWAKKQNLTDPNLLNFAEFSKSYFYKVCYDKTKVLLADCKDVTQAQLNELLEFSSEINVAYYAGNLCVLCQELESNPSYLLWKEKAGDFWSWAYLQSYLKYPPKDENRAEFSLLRYTPKQ